ncbi:MAG: InlB B-repeat-containing protein, partial [Thermoplasmatota archaeon]
MKFYLKIKRNYVLKNFVVSVITFILIFTLIIPTINSKFIIINNEKLESYIKNFDPLCDYTLTINIIGNGSVTKNPDKIKYPPGTIVQLTAIPETGWSFSHWSGDLTGSENPINITMNSNKIVYANFILCEYTLTLTTSGTGTGTIQASPPGPTYPYGTIVTIWANASIGSTFTGFSGDLTGTNTPQNLTMNSNKNVNAEFTINQYTLTINTQGNGTVNKNPDYPTYPYGTIVTLTAIPDTGWTFDHWSGDLTGNQNPTNITMNENKNITAHFTINQYTLTINTQGNGTV